MICMCSIPLLNTPLQWGVEKQAAQQLKDRNKKFLLATKQIVFLVLIIEKRSTEIENNVLNR